MNVRERLYDAYISSGQAGGTVLNQLQEGKELFSNNGPYITQLIERHIPNDRNARIVDLGCGHGAYLYFLKQKGYQNLVGIDTSAEQVALAHRLDIQEVQCGDINEFLEQDSEAVDVVLLMDILEHLPLEIIMDLLDKVFSKLSKGGRLIIHVPNAEGLFGMRVRYGDLTHEQSFTPTSMQQLLKTTGFSTIGYSEDKPVVHGMTSLIRRVIWDTMTAPHRLLLMAETGETHFVLTQNMLVVAQKGD
jgi:SAM-dependent methyltransferase